MHSKEKAIVDRIKHLEDAIAKGREFLESGKHADWHGFRPMFVDKGGPPHKDWIKNVFLPRREKALSEAHKSLEKLTWLAQIGEQAGCTEPPDDAGVPYCLYPARVGEPGRWVTSP